MTKKQVNEITEVIRLLAHGPLSGPGAHPMGMEAISMALAGQNTPGEDSVAAGLHDVASSLGTIAGGLFDIAQAIGAQGEAGQALQQHTQQRKGGGHANFTQSTGQD